MSTDRNRLKQLFAQAIELRTPEREEFLSVECVDDPGLRGAVEELLNEESANFLNRPVAAVEGSKPGLMTGRALGDFLVEELIGAGGFGEVYRGRRVGGFEQEVAIKFLQLGRLDWERRFQRELETLASLGGHEGIVTAIASGVTDDQIPYYVMEHVEGQPLDRYCDEHRLPLAARVELFLKVCAIVEHAHRNFVLHRDLKPGNILVTGSGQIRLLDFGLAATLHSVPAADPDAFTPAYASPEQVSKGAALTTASDVYSLGVVLFELLTGHRPYDTTGTREAVEKLICTTPPATPSEVVLHNLATSGSGVARTVDAVELAARRGESPRRLRRRLTGDLESILLKSLDKSPTGRYPTVGELSEDLRLHQGGFPVQARPTGAFGACHRWCRRKPLVAASLLAAFLSAVGFGGYAFSKYRQTVAAMRTRDVALANEVSQRHRADAAASFAREQVIFAHDAIREFMQAIEESSSGLTDETKARFFNVALNHLEQMAAEVLEHPGAIEESSAEILLSAVESLDPQLEIPVGAANLTEALILLESFYQERWQNVGQPKWRNFLLRVVLRTAQIEMANGSFGEAAGRLESSRALAVGARDVEGQQLRLKQQLLMAECVQRQSGLEAAGPLYDSALKHAEQLLKGAPDDHGLQLEFANIAGRQFDLLLAQGETEVAGELLERIIELPTLGFSAARENPERRTISKNHVVALMKLGDVALARKQVDQAARWFAMSLEMADRFVEFHPEQFDARHNLAVARVKLHEIHEARGNLDAALQLLLDARKEFATLAKLRPLAFQPALDQILALDKLATVQLKRLNFEEAMIAAEERLQVSIRFHQNHPNLAASLESLVGAHKRIANIHKEAGRANGAIVAMKTSLDLNRQWSQRVPPTAATHRRTAMETARLALWIMESGDIREAADYVKQAIGLYDDLAKEAPDQMISTTRSVLIFRQAMLALWLRNIELARESFAEAERLATELNAPPLQVAQLNRAQGEYFLQVGPLSAARAKLEAARSVCGAMAKSDPQAADLLREVETSLDALEPLTALLKSHHKIQPPEITAAEFAFRLYDTYIANPELPREPLLVGLSAEQMGRRLLSIRQDLAEMQKPSDDSTPLVSAADVLAALARLMNARRLPDDFPITEMQCHADALQCLQGAAKSYDAMKVYRQLRNPDFDPIRKTPEFQQLVQSLESRLATE